VRTTAKAGLGCAAAAPLVSAVFIGCYVAYELIVHDLGKRGLGATPDPLELVTNGPFGAEHALAFGVLIAAIAVLELALAVVLTVHAVRDPRLAGTGIALWVAGFLFAGPIALPLYVALYVLREPPPKRIAALDQPPLAR
jgi:hypothetical protein